MKCDLCNRKANIKYIWNLNFYNLKCLNVCEECDMSMEEQIWDNLIYFKEKR